MSSTKCQAKNPELCVDPNCPEKRHQQAILDKAVESNDVSSFLAAKEQAVVPNLEPSYEKIQVKDLPRGSVLSSGVKILDVHRRLRLRSNQREVYLERADGSDWYAAVWNAYTYVNVYNGKNID